MPTEEQMKEAKVKALLEGIQTEQKLQRQQLIGITVMICLLGLMLVVGAKKMLADG